MTSRRAHSHFPGSMGSSYVPLPGDPASTSLLQWAKRLREDRGFQKDCAVPKQPGAGADERQGMSGEGQLAISQGSKRDHPSLGQEGGLQASGFSLGAAPGIDYCGGRWGGADPSMDQHSPQAQCPQLGHLISGYHCCSQGYLNAPLPYSWMACCPCSAALAMPRQSSMPTAAASARSYASACSSE